MIFVIFHYYAFALFKIFVISPWTALLLLLLLLCRKSSLSFETKVIAVPQVRGSPGHFSLQFIQKCRSFKKKTLEFSF